MAAAFWTILCWYVYITALGFCASAAEKQPRNPSVDRKLPPDWRPESIQVSRQGSHPWNVSFIQTRGSDLHKLGRQARSHLWIASLLQTGDPDLRKFSRKILAYLLHGCKS